MVSMAEYHAELDANDRANRAPGWQGRIADRAERLARTGGYPAATATRAATTPAVNSPAVVGPVEVAAATVRPGVRRVVERAVAYAVRALNLPGLTAHYFEPSSFSGAGGLYATHQPGRVWLAANIPDGLADLTALHECRHAWQYTRLPADDARLQETPAAERWRENDARAWSERARQAMMRETWNR